MKKLLTVALITSSVMACQTPPAAITPPALPAPNAKLETVVKADATTIAPLPDKIEGLDLDQVALGDKLFHDKRLSKDNTVSCASCHGLNTGGVDRLPRSKGVGGAEGGVNSPTVFNSSFNFVQFWDGRAKDLHEQAGGPVMNPVEMASSNWDEVIAKLKADPEYVEKFAKLYTDGMTGNNIQAAIATFEKTLITPNSRFDKYLKGDKASLTQEELKGWELFQGYSCTTCHNGINIGGNSFQKFGLVKDYLTDVRGNVTENDFGRFNVTKDEADKFKFKVPSLRTAAITAPYFHDASAKTLEDAITIMGRHQLGIEFQQNEIKALAAFIRSLVGEYKGQPLK
jgi:cytochrome c peroxidase